MATSTPPVADTRDGARPSQIGRKAGKYSVIYTVATFFVVFAGLPFAWMVFTVFKQSSDLYNGQNNPLKYNDAPTLEHVRALFSETNYEVFLKNTIYVFKLEDGTEIELRGDEEIEYDGEVTTVANLYDAMKEGYYGRF